MLEINTSKINNTVTFTVDRNSMKQAMVCLSSSTTLATAADCLAGVYDQRESGAVPGGTYIP